MIQPTGFPAFHVYCDMTDGGWTVFMRRYDGSQDFNLYWDQYKKGFGDLGREHWLGNDKLYYLTNQKQYRMKMEATIWATGEKKHALYNTFRIEGESSNYKLHVGGYSGNTVIDHWAYSNGMEFSTKDRDNDKVSDTCTGRHKGAFWYNACYRVHPTGLYMPSSYDSMNLFTNHPKPVREMTLKIKSV